MVSTQQVCAEETSEVEYEKTIAGLCTSVITDPINPGDDKNKAWTGSYVYYGKYAGTPVKYRVLDANTTDYSMDRTTRTMLLDCDSILYKQKFNEGFEKNNAWVGSDIRISLNGDGFLDKDGVFTNPEKNAISTSTRESHTLNNDQETSVDVDSWTERVFAKYTALMEDKVFLLDAEDVCNGTYGYSWGSSSWESRKKTSSSATYWWLRSAYYLSRNDVGCVSYDEGQIYYGNMVDFVSPGVSPAFNLNLSSVLFTSVINGTVGKTGAEYKLTLLDGDMDIRLNAATAENSKTVTLCYSISGNNNDNVNQVSVLVLDKEYTVGNINGATVLDYQKLNADSFPKNGSGTYTLPESLSREGCGTDYHMYIIAEDINEEKETDYASEPKEVTTISDKVDTVIIPSIDTPIPEQLLQEKVSLSATDVEQNATIIWKKDGTEVTGNAEWKTTYQAYMTLTPTKEYAFTHATRVIMNDETVGAENITFNNDGTLTVDCGKYTTATRRVKRVTAPEIPRQFANYYVADNVFAAKELKVPAKVTLEGKTQPNPKEMEVEWINVDSEGNTTTYDATAAATNIFKWTVKASEYEDYDLNGVMMEGTVVIQNKNYTPVNITGDDVTVIYNGKGVLDVSKYFTIDENKGTTTYELLSTSTGTGTLKGTILTITQLGTFDIKASTPINGVYDKSEHTLAITVDKSNTTPNMPESTMSVSYDQKTVGTVELPEGWVWRKVDSVKELSVDKAVEATAIYNGVDKGNYVTESVTISIIRQECKHTWDNGVVTKEAIATEKGERIYTCTMCKATKTEEIAALGVPEVGEEITSEDGSATYKVTEAGEDGNAVTYEAPTDKNATTVVVPATVTINNLTYNVTTISDTAFGGNKKLTSVTIGDNVTGFSAKTFKGCTSLKTLNTGNGVTSIPANAFKNFKNLTTVKMGTGVKTIGKNAFSGCKKLKNLTFGKNVVTIGDKAFYKCSALTKVTIPSKVKTIGKSAFEGCKELETVTIGKSVTKIGDKAFYGCSKMKTLTIKSSKLTTKKIGSKAFTKAPKSMIVKIPKKKFKVYKSMLIKKGVNKKARFKKS